MGRSRSETLVKRYRQQDEDIRVLSWGRSHRTVEKGCIATSLRSRVGLQNREPAVKLGH